RQKPPVRHHTPPRRPSITEAGSRVQVPRGAKKMGAKKSGRALTLASVRPAKWKVVQTQNWKRTPSCAWNGMPSGSEKPVAPKKLTGLPKSASPSTFWNSRPKFAVLKTLKASKKRPSLRCSPHAKNFETRTFNCLKSSPRIVFGGSECWSLPSREARFSNVTPSRLMSQRQLGKTLQRRGDAS